MKKNSFSLFFFFLNAAFLLDKIRPTVNKKLQKSFDEIFGEGWREKGGEIAINLNEQKDEIEYDKIIEECYQCQGNNHLSMANRDEQEWKRELVNQFQAIKQRIRQKGKFLSKEWNKFDGKIAKKFGTNRTKIYEWKKELGMGKSKQINAQQKSEIINQFHAIKEKLKQKRKYSSKDWNNFEKKIAKKLGINQCKIYKWKRELRTAPVPARKAQTVEQKKEIIDKFHAIKEKIKEKGKFSSNEWRKFEKTIAKKLGTSHYKIYKWKREFGMDASIKKPLNDHQKSVIKRLKSRKKGTRDAQRIEIINKFYQLINDYKQEGKHTRMEWQQFYAKIAAKFGISARTIRKWKKELGIKVG